MQTNTDSNREIVNRHIARLKGLGNTKREIWKGKLRNRSI